MSAAAEKVISPASPWESSVTPAAVENPPTEDGAGMPTKKLRRTVTLDDQSQSAIKGKKLVVVIASLACIIFLASFQQISVSTTLPGIARDFGASTAISWVGTAFLVANTSTQVLYSRLSDIFGRKTLLAFAIVLFMVGNLLCGFSRNLTQLITFQVIAGLGGGGILVLVLIIVSDVSTLRTRGKFQALVGVGVAMGAGIGPFLGGLFTQKITWRWVFWVTLPISALSLIQIIFFLPLKSVTGSFKSKLKKVDFLGVATSLVATVFILVPISLGGAEYAWNSALVITMLCVGVVFLIGFIIVEWKFAILPMMPLRLLHHRSLGLLTCVSFTSGIYYYTNAYFLPIYFQVAMNPPAGALLSAGLLQALLLPQIATAMGAGFVVQKLGHWNPLLWMGYGIYVVAAGVQTTFERNTSHAYIVGILIVEGFGIGWTMQTALVAAQAIAPPADRAVITGIRNLFRFVGGSFGLAIASAIMNNIIHSQISKAGLPASITSQITGVQFNIPAGLTSEQVEVLLDAEMEGVRGVFWLLFGVSILTLLMSLPVEDHGLPMDPSKKAADEEAPPVVEKITEGGESEKSEEGEMGEECEENRHTPEEIPEIRDIEEQ